MAKPNLKRDWQPDKAAFDRLLAWLDEGTDSRGERYLEMRERLVDYFGRRNCHSPEDLADDTLNRVARRLEETGSIDDVVPARYCYIVAKFVFLESLRRPGRTELVAQSAEAVVAQVADDRAENERTFACLERCLQSCSAVDRAMILDYYGRRAVVPGRIAGSSRRSWGSRQIPWPFAPAGFEVGSRGVSVPASPRRHIGRNPSHQIRRHEP
jgi:DNA-directed RNA polymerase specialized sigma24 family protein